jgi:hypothetical protein
VKHRPSGLGAPFIAGDGVSDRAQLRRGFGN